MSEFKIAPHTPPPALVIQGRHGKEIGRLDLTCEPAKFTGDVDESARVLFECVIALHSARIRELEKQLAAALSQQAGVVEALRDLEEALDEYGEFEDSEAAEAVIEKARAALAAVKGETP